MSYKLKIRHKNINKEDYKTEEEYNFHKETDLIPKKNNKLLCVILSNTKIFDIVYRSSKQKDFFTYHGGKYIIDTEAIYISQNGVRFSVYFEGISTPLKHSYIIRKLEKVSYIDLQGEKKNIVIEKIKGLKFDSKILDIFTNKVLAENFTKYSIDNFQVFILLFCIVNIVLTGIVAGLVYYFAQ